MGKLRFGITMGRSDKAIGLNWFCQADRKPLDPSDFDLQPGEWSFNIAKLVTIEVQFG